MLPVVSFALISKRSYQVKMYAVLKLSQSTVTPPFPKNLPSPDTFLQGNILSPTFSLILLFSVFVNLIGENNIIFTLMSSCVTFCVTRKTKEFFQGSLGNFNFFFCQIAYYHSLLIWDNCLLIDLCISNSSHFSSSHILHMLSPSLSFSSYFYLLCFLEIFQKVIFMIFKKTGYRNKEH